MKTILLMMLVATTAFAAEHDHSHGDAAGQLQLNHGKKWATTETLRQGMERIRVLVDRSIPEIHNHKMKAESFKILAAKVSKEVEEIIKTCRLEPQADAMLHLVLGRFLKGVAEIEKGRTFDARHEGAMEFLAALQQYNKYFEHPGWKSVSH